MKCDQAGHLLTTDAMSAAQTLRKPARSAGLSRPDPAQVQSMAAKRPTARLCGFREQVAGAYGGNAARLRVLKRRFDPDGVFASAIPLPER